MQLMASKRNKKAPVVNGYMSQYQQDVYVSVQARVPAGVISHPCMDPLPAPEARFTRATDGLDGDFYHAVKKTL